MESLKTQFFGRRGRDLISKNAEKFSFRYIEVDSRLDILFPCQMLVTCITTLSRASLGRKVKLYSGARDEANGKRKCETAKISNGPTTKNIEIKLNIL